LNVNIINKQTISQTHSLLHTFAQTYYTLRKGYKKKSKRQ